MRSPSSAGCSASADYDGASASDGVTATSVPHWIREGARLARSTKAARENGRALTPSAIPIGATGTKAATPALPSRDVVVAALVSTGLTATQAGCIYDGVSANPQTAADVSALIGGLTNPSGATASAATAGLTPDATNRLVMSVAPCLDQATLLALLAAGQGVGTGGVQSQLASLLASAQGLDAAKLVGLDPAALAKTVAGALGSDQVKQLQALLASVGSAQSAASANPLAGLDLEHLDLSKLTKDQMPLLVLALLKGLTPEQQGQLGQLTKVQLDQLHINIDPDKLTPEEVGTLLLIISPLLAGAISTDPAKPGPGGPGQVYIPPGLDLSNINPLVFLNRADVLAQFAKQGMDPTVSACIFDSMARMSASTIAAFFSTGESSQAALASFLLAAVSCIAQGR
ncbi:MAG: hypothetical protein U0Q22_07125 [Acidimicrobiales bacterium]